MKFSKLTESQITELEKETLSKIVGGNDLDGNDGDDRCYWACADHTINRYTTDHRAG